MRKKEFTFFGQSVVTETFEGAVLQERTATSTEIYSRTTPGFGNQAPTVNVHSDTIKSHNFWIKDSDGGEINITTSHFDHLPIREGHIVRAVQITNPKLNKRTWMAFQNLSTPSKDYRFLLPIACMQMIGVRSRSERPMFWLMILMFLGPMVFGGMMLGGEGVFTGGLVGVASLFLIYLPLAIILGLIQKGPLKRHYQKVLTEIMD